MNETEIERLVVRLVGDGSSFETMVHTAETASKQAADTVQQYANQIEQIGQSLEGFARNAVQALGSLEVTNFLRQSFEGFEGRETMMIRLSAAIRQNGSDVESTVAEYRAFARSLSEVSTASTSMILNSLRQAESFGLTGERAERATHNAMMLSYATKGNADATEHLIRVTEALEKGEMRQAMMHSRQITQLRGVRDETQFLIEYNKLLASGLEMSEKIANSSAGQITRLTNTYKAFKADLGEIVADVIKPYVISLRETVEWLKGLDKGTKTVIVAVLGLIAAALALGPALTVLSKWATLSFSPLVLGIVAAGAAIGIWVNEVGGVANAWTIAKGAVVDFYHANETLVHSIAASAAAVALAVLAYKTLSFAIGLTYTILSSLGVIKLASIALWLTWSAAVLYAEGMMWLFHAAFLLLTGQFGAFSIATGLSTAMTAAWSVGTVAASAAMWLWSVAVEVGTAAMFLWGVAVAAVSGNLLLFLTTIAGTTVGTFLWSVITAIASGNMLLLSTTLLGATIGTWLYNVAVAAASGNLLFFLTTLLGASVGLALWNAFILISKAAVWLWTFATTTATAVMAAYAAGGMSAAISLAALAVATLVAKVAVWLLNGAVAALDVLLGGIPIVIGLVVAAVAAFIVVILAVVAAIALWVIGTWLLGAALTALTFVLAGVVAIFVGPILMAIAMVAAAVAGVIAFVDDLRSSFAGVERTTGPLRQITALFGEWFGIIKRIIEAAEVDMPLAMKILKAAWHLALLEIQALWGPLWEYIKTNSTNLWRVITLSARIHWLETVEAVKSELLNLPNYMSRAFSAALAVMRALRRRFTGEITQQQAAADIAIATGTIQTTAGTLADLQRQYREAQGILAASIRSNISVIETQEIRDARARVSELAAQIPVAQERARLLEGQLNHTGDGLGKAVKHAEHLKASLTGSADALTSIAEYRERNQGVLLQAQAGSTLGGAGSAAPGSTAASSVGSTPSSPASAGGFDSTIQVRIQQLLSEIRDYVRRLPDNPLTVDNLAIAGGF